MIFFTFLIIGIVLFLTLNGFFNGFSFKLKYGTLSFFGTKEKMNTLNQESITDSKNGNEIATIIIHGAGASYYKDVYGMTVWLKSQGFNPISFDYDYKDSPDISAEKLAEFVDEVLVKTDKSKVNILGLCLGGLLAKYYVQEFNASDKIEKFVSVVSPAKIIPKKEPAYQYNKFFSFDPEPWNFVLKELENKNPIDNHLYIYCKKDLLVPSKYQFSQEGNYLGLSCGHSFINSNPEILNRTVDFFQKK